jgi:hypothetical protein
VIFHPKRFYTNATNNRRNGDDEGLVMLSLPFVEAFAAFAGSVK